MYSKSIIHQTLPLPPIIRTLKRKFSTYFKRLAAHMRRYMQNYDKILIIFQQLVVAQHNQRHGTQTLFCYKFLNCFVEGVFFFFFIIYKPEKFFQEINFMTVTTCNYRLFSVFSLFYIRNPQSSSFIQKVFFTLRCVPLKQIGKCEKEFKFNGITAHFLHFPNFYQKVVNIRTHSWYQTHLNTCGGLSNT